MTSQSTSPAMNADLVRAGFQAFNSGDADAAIAALQERELRTNLPTSFPLFQVAVHSHLDGPTHPVAL